MQIVGYDTRCGDDRAPALLLASDGSVERHDLVPGAPISFSLGSRHCAGVVDGTTHRSCPNNSAPYCDAHSSTWICARCTGTCLKAEMDCYEEHAIYLAGFAPDVLKVGVTRSWRLETRLREQGADRYAHLQTVSNGRIAREREAALAETYTDRVRVPTKIDGLGQEMDDTVWNRAVNALDPLETGQIEYNLSLDRRPVDETIANGTVRGTKGRVLVLDAGETTYAVDLRALVGYELSDDAPNNSRQSSLGSF